MSEMRAPGGTEGAEADAGTAARRIARAALKGALGTLDRSTGHPYASLVTLATAPDGSPLMLVSRLALHTQNILADDRASVLADDRASVLADASAGDGNPLAGGRVTLLGRAMPIEDETVRRRFLARHPDAAGYAGFADFMFVRLEVERAHYVGGFGRIVGLDGSRYRLSLEGAEALLAAEAEIIGHMNEDHRAAVELYATRLMGAPPGPWALTGVDPEGCDIVCRGTALRLPFGSRVISPAAIRQEFVRLAELARSRPEQPQS